MNNTILFSCSISIIGLFVWLSVTKKFSIFISPDTTTNLYSDDMRLRQNCFQNCVFKMSLIFHKFICSQFLVCRTRSLTNSKQETLILWKYQLILWPLYKYINYFVLRIIKIKLQYFCNIFVRPAVIYFASFFL